MTIPTVRLTFGANTVEIPVHQIRGVDRNSFGDVRVRWDCRVPREDGAPVVQELYVAEDFLDVLAAIVAAADQEGQPCLL